MFRQCLSLIVFASGPVLGFNSNASAAPSPLLAAASACTTAILAADSRIPINPPAQPMSGSAMVVINRPGSYYLTGTIEGRPGLNGIEIRVSNVTLNLNGWSLRGVPGSGSGIVVDQRMNANIFNGSIRLWDGDGIDLSRGGNAKIANVSVGACGGTGIKLGQGTLTDCLVRDCGQDGIVVGDGSSIKNSMSILNGNAGFIAGSGSTLNNCTSESNGGDGFSIGASSMITACLTWANAGNGMSAGAGSTIERCTAGANSRTGIEAGSASTVRANTSAANDGDGISASSGCYVFENNCSDNGDTAAGIRITGFGPGGRIDSNNTSGNGWGILVEGSTNMIVRNTAGGNAINYDFAQDNHAGKIVKSKKGQISSPNAWANFAF